MLFDEVWSYSVDRISEYFQNRGAESHGSAYVLGGAEIRLEELAERQVGSISFPQTRVIIEGDNDSEVERIYHAFYLNFLSGGA